MDDNKKTVYILGAGFSRAFSEMAGMEPKFPLMNNFMVDIDKDSYWSSSFPKDERSALVKWIDDHYTTRKGVNVEELMTMFELMKEGYLETIDFNEYEGQRILAVKLAHALKNYLINRLKIDLKSDNIFATYFCNWLDYSFRSSVYLTLNYDILFEDLISQIKSSYLSDMVNWQFLTESRFNIGTDYQVLNFENLPIYLLKLHGSLDWYCCSNIYCGQNIIIYSDYASPQFIDSSVIRKRNRIPRSFCPICGSPIEFVLIPPQIIKDINKFPKLKVMWRLANQCLSIADRIVIIGYSIPPNDTRTTYMLMSSLQGKEKELEWIIVDYKPKPVIDRLKEILPKHENLNRISEKNGNLFDGENAVLNYLKTFNG